MSTSREAGASPGGATLKEILDIPDAAMDQAMGTAYQLYLAGRFADAETVCRGLIACDHRYWWSHVLHASVLRRLDRPLEALHAVEEGLKHEPAQPKLCLMRRELLATLGRHHSGGDQARGGCDQASTAQTPNVNQTRERTSP